MLEDTSNDALSPRTGRDPDAMRGRQVANACLAPRLPVGAHSDAAATMLSEIRVLRERTQALLDEVEDRIRVLFEDVERNADAVRDGLMTLREDARVIAAAWYRIPEVLPFGELGAKMQELETAAHAVGVDQMGAEFALGGGAPGLLGEECFDLGERPGMDRRSRTTGRGGNRCDGGMRRRRRGSPVRRR